MAPKPKYTPEELEKKLDEYFQMKKEEGKKKKLVYMSVYDVCTFLDVSYKTWERWGEKPGYVELIERAMTKIINAWMPNLFYPGRNATGTIFWAKNNANMRDKVEHQVSGRIQHTHTARLDQVDQDTLQQLSAVVQALREGQEQEAIDVTPDDDTD